MISFENQLNRESKLKFAKYPTMSILQFPPDWGFGNRILYYNNLIQLTNKHNQEWRKVFRMAFRLNKKSFYLKRKTIR